MNKQPILRRFQEAAVDIEVYLENFWVNVLLSCVILTVWIIVMTTLAAKGLLLGSGISGNKDTWWVWIALSLLAFFVLKPLRVGMDNLWALVLWLLVIFWAFSTAEHRWQSNPALLQEYWRWNLVLAALWLFTMSIHTLVFIFQNGRQRLLAYWIFHILGLCILSGVYWCSAEMGLLFALLSPPRPIRRWLLSPSEKEQVVRGRRLQRLARAERVYGKLAARLDSPTLLFGGLNIPLYEATTHFLIVGSIGSGKTISLNVLMAQVLPLIQKGSGRRAIVFDAKRDVVSTLFGIVGIASGVDIHLLNPFDVRATAWDLAQDICTFADAEALANILIPEPSVSGERADRFFRDAAVLLLRGITEFFLLHAPGRWTLRDLVLAFQNEELLRAILGSDSMTAHYLTALATEKTSANIMASVLVEVGKYSIIAALWDRASRSISLQDWLQGGSILVLGKDRRAEATLASLNRLMMTRISQILLNQPEQREPQTFLFFDELQSIKIDSLQALATEGRSKGICLFAAFQNVESLKQLYGAEGTETITGQFRHKALLRLDDNVTSEWASRLIGESEVLRASSSFEWKGNILGIGHGAKAGFNRQISSVRAVLPSELTSIPPIDPSTGQGLTGYYLTRGFHQHYYSWETLKSLLVAKDTSQPDFLEAPAEWQMLRPWGAEDYHRLGIAPLMQELERKRLLEDLDHRLKANRSIPPVTEDTDTDGFLYGEETTPEEMMESTWSTDEPAPDNSSPTPFSRPRPQQKRTRKPSPDPRQSRQNQQRNERKP